MKKKILIVSANYYGQISKNLLNNAKKTLGNKFILKIINVPGAFEIPVIISQYIKNYHGAIALGCEKLKINKKSIKLDKSQAVASIGQIELMNLYKNIFNKYKINLDLRPQNINFYVYYKLTQEYEKLRS